MLMLRTPFQMGLAFFVGRFCFFPKRPSFLRHYSANLTKRTGHECEVDKAYNAALSFMQQRRASLSEKWNERATAGIDEEDKLYEKLVFSDPHFLHKWKLGQVELPIPTFSGMSNSQWRQEYGPQLTRQLAKLYHIIAMPGMPYSEPVLPYETEALVNLYASFNATAVGRGNIILPDKTDSQPAISYTIDDEALKKCPVPLHYTSVFLFDLDYPNAATSQLDQYCHWAHVNVGYSEKMKDEKFIVIDAKDKETTAFPYQPPHPQRGTGYHRYILLLLGHEEKMFISSDNRYLHILEMLRTRGLFVLSYVWFRSCWIKHVNHLAEGKAKLVFGEKTQQ